MIHYQKVMKFSLLAPACYTTVVTQLSNDFVAKFVSLSHILPYYSNDKGYPIIRIPTEWPSGSVTKNTQGHSKNS